MQLFVRLTSTNTAAGLYSLLRTSIEFVCDAMPSDGVRNKLEANLWELNSREWLCFQTIDNWKGMNWYACLIWSNTTRHSLRDIRSSISTEIIVETWKWLCEAEFVGFPDLSDIYPSIQHSPGRHSIYTWTDTIVYRPALYTLDLENSAVNDSAPRKLIGS